MRNPKRGRAYAHPAANRPMKFPTFQINDLLQFPAIVAPGRTPIRLGYVLPAAPRRRELSLLYHIYERLASAFGVNTD